MKIRLAAAMVAVLLLTVGAASAQAGTNKPWLGVYDCYAYEYIGFNQYGLVYKHSSRLKKDGKYQQAFGRKDGKLTNPTSGKWAYKADKKKIVFKTGAFSNIFGKWNKPSDSYPKGTYTEYLKSDPKSTPGTCYPTKFK
jgi:hypothetical protein